MSVEHKIHRIQHHHHHHLHLHHILESHHLYIHNQTIQNYILNHQENLERERELRNRPISGQAEVYGHANHASQQSSLVDEQSLASHQVAQLEQPGTQVKQQSPKRDGEHNIPGRELHCSKHRYQENHLPNVRPPMIQSPSSPHNSLSSSSSTSLASITSLASASITQYHAITRATSRHSSIQACHREHSNSQCISNNNHHSPIPPSNSAQLNSKQRSQIHFLLLSAFAYILSPIDLIPEMIFGVFGILDDILFLFLCLFCVAIILLYPLFRELRRTLMSKGLGVVQHLSYNSSPSQNNHTETNLLPIEHKSIGIPNKI